MKRLKANRLSHLAHGTDTNPAHVKARAELEAEQARAAEPVQRVTFRKFKSDPQRGPVIAFFPDQREGSGFIGSYMHVGQHGPAMYPHPDTVPATPDEYAPLLKELQGLGYKLRIVSRMVLK